MKKQTSAAKCQLAQMYHKVFTVILRKRASGFLELTACNFTVFLKKSIWKRFFVVQKNSLNRTKNIEKVQFLIPVSFKNTKFLDLMQGLVRLAVTMRFYANLPCLRGNARSDHHDGIRIHPEASWIHDERILREAAQDL